MNIRRNFCFRKGTSKSLKTTLVAKELLKLHQKILRFIFSSNWLRISCNKLSLPNKIECCSKRTKKLPHNLFQAIQVFKEY